MRKMKRLLFVPSRWLRLTLFAGRLFSLCDGILEGFIVEILRLEHQLFRIQKFRLKPGPSCFFGGHPMVLKKATGCKRRSPQNAHPANFFTADERTQSKIQTDCHTYCQQRTDKLPGRKSKKDGLLIIPDFLWYFYFYIIQLPSWPYSPNNSLTIRSLIRTAPTKTSRLKISSNT